MNEEQIKEVTTMAAAFMTKAEIAAVMEFEDAVLASDVFVRAFDAGYLHSKFKVQKSVVDLAQAGSSPAQTMAAKMMTEVPISDIFNG